MVRHHNQTTAAVAMALALATSLAPIASADPAPLARAEAVIAAAPALATSPAPCGDVCSGHGYGLVSPAATSFRVASGDGFNWGDAGIGAGASVLLLGIGLAGTRIATKARNRPAGEQHTIATR
jgi:hypothetical protein